MSFARRCLGVSTALALSTSLIGCGGSSSSGTTTTPAPPTLTSGGAATVYATQGTTPGTIVAFSTSGSGTVSPATTLTMPTGFTLYTVAVDRSSGVIYAGGAINTMGGGAAGTPEILAFAAGASGNATPARTILNTYASGGSTLTAFDGPSVMTTDSSGNLYVLSDLANVAVYASTATGNIAPSRIISGAATLLNAAPLGAAVDSSGNLFVSTVTLGTTYSGAIYEYSNTAAGNIAPTNKLTSSSQFFYGLSVDTGNNLYAVVESTVSGVTSHSPSINKYTVSSTAITQANTISASGSFVYLLGLQVDTVGNIFTLNQNTASSYAIFGFNSSQTGSTTPAYSVTSTALSASTNAAIALR